MERNAGAARLPAAAPTVRFPGYLNYIFNTPGSPENFQKKFLEQVSSLFQNKEEHDACGLYGNRSSNVTAIKVLSLVRNRR